MLESGKTSQHPAALSPTDSQCLVRKSLRIQVQDFLGWALRGWVYKMHQKMGSGGPRDSAHMNLMGRVVLMSRILERENPYIWLGQEMPLWGPWEARPGKVDSIWIIGGHCRQKKGSDQR